MHADYGALELATKEIARIAERINVSPSDISLIFRNLRDGNILHGFLISRKEICDRILAKGRSINNINTDLAKSYGRRTDKLRSSIGLGAGWHDETSELYNDLVTRFAKQGIKELDETNPSHSSASSHKRSGRVVERLQGLSRQCGKSYHGFEVMDHL